LSVELVSKLIHGRRESIQLCNREMNCTAGRKTRLRAVILQNVEFLQPAKFKGVRRHMLVVVLGTIAKLNVLLDESECDLWRTEVTGLE
jgi:hypothetical protein